MSITVITTILSLIQQAIGLFGASTNTTAMIANIVNVLEAMLPSILNFIPTFYSTVKNIITALTADPSTTADQLATLQALDAQVDAAFEAAAVAVDPDAQPTG